MAMMGPATTRDEWRACARLNEQRFNVQNVGSLEEKTVDFGVDEGLKLLKASLECKNVLTSVFLVFYAAAVLSVKRSVFQRTHDS
ncbi:hypothetical protein QYF36_005160 [Acer negundo]|nr:hypothetical protein QYF36_005160 [Acer negundo]